MAILASNYMTLADVMKQSHNGDIESDIVEIMSESDDIIKDAHFKECNDGTNNITVIRSGLPDATFRALYGFVPTSKSETQQVKDNTGMLEAYSVVDVDIVDKAKNPNQVRLNEAKAFIEAMGQKVQKTVIYGSKTGDEKAFDGLAVRYDHISTDKNNIGFNVVDGGGKGTKNTSIWFICWGENAVSLLYPNGSKGGIQRKDHGQLTETNKDGAKRQVYQEHFKMDVGLSVKDWRSTCRIANIDVDELEAGNVKILDLLRKAYHKVYRHAKKQGLKLFAYASPAIVEAIDKAATDKTNVMLTYKTYGGEDVVHYKNVPIRTIDQILETEEQVKAKA